MARADFLKGVFAPINIGREDTLRSIERLSATTHLVSAAEYLARPRELEPGSLGDWEVLNQRFAHLRRWQRKLLAVASRPVVTRTLHAGRILAAVTLLAPTGPRLRAVANGYLAATAGALYPRGNYGSDGSDQVSFQSSAAALVARVAPTPGVQDAAIWYLALQSGLAYAVSGWVKLFGPSWRSGTAVPGVMRTRSYGNRRIWTLFKDRPRLAALSAHGMLAFEGLFPLVFLAKGRLTRPFILGAAAFHTFIAGSMGLGRFLTGFGSMLPAVAYATNDRPKSKLVPTLALTSIATALAAGAVAGGIRRRRVRRPRIDHHTLTCSSGNTIHYKRQHSRPGAPVLILEHGMASTPQHFGWIIEHLPTDLDIVTYWRAGYGPSDNITGGYGFEDGSDDLADLIDSLPHDIGPLYLGGHSLGGLIARGATLLTERPVAGVIYIDSSHPGQLSISESQRKGAKGMTAALATLPATMKLGWGWLLPRPPWLKALPENVRKETLDQYRDARLWQAGSREWLDARRRFSRKRSAQLETIATPALVITAENTLRADFAQDTLHRELGDSHSSATRVVILGADHDTVLTNQHHAATTSDAIAAFIQETQAA